MLSPLPSNPHRPTRFSITAVRHLIGEEHARIHCVGFYECYGAAVWLRVMIGNEECVRRGNELVTASGIKLRSTELEQIMSYKLNSKEADYRLPDEYMRWIACFRRASWEVVPEPVKLEVRTMTSAEVPVKRTKQPRDDRPAGYITIGELCKGTPVQPMNARALLRASNYIKPTYGWAFAPADVPAIRKLCGL